MDSLNVFAKTKLAELELRHLRRSLIDTAPGEGAYVERAGRRLVSFSNNDYLGFTRHPEIVRAATDAIHRYGVGAGASRLVTGNHPLYGVLESRLARLKGTEAACVFGSGYLANTGIIPSLVGAGDVILIDELAHACVWAGAQLSKAHLLHFPHNDVDAVKALLREHRHAHARALIATDGVFSMDGDLAPLVELGEVAQEFDAWLMSDDAHGIGVVGCGRGSTFAAGRAADVPLQMGTLSKAIGSYGGYVCASHPVIDLIKTRARTLIYSTALPPAVVAAAIAAIDLIERNPTYAALPLMKAKAFTRLTGLPEAVSPIVPIIVGTATAALSASRKLEDEGFLVVAIRPPTVPDGTARLRLAFTAEHSDQDVARLAEMVRTQILAPVP